MTCSVEPCDEATPKADDFCPTHWRALPRWARQELIALKRLAKRGGIHGLNYLKAVAVARRLAARASSSAQAAPAAP